LDRRCRLTPRDRVLAALRHQETDRLPYQVYFTRHAQDRLAAHLGDADFAEHLGNHIDRASFDGFTEQIPDRPGFFRDDFGVLWDRSGLDADVGTPEGLTLPEPSLSRYKFPEPRRADADREFEKLMRNGKETLKICRISLMLFERAWSMRGMENVLMDMLDSPSFVEELLDGICESQMRLIDIGLAWDVDGFYFGDDWGQQRGMIMGPQLWRRFLKPRLARIYDQVKSHGKCIIQHSCGDIQAILPDLIELGVDAYQSLQPEIYDLNEVKREYGADLCFWGGISVQKFLLFASPDEVRARTRQVMALLGHGGGYIAGPTHWITADVPPENTLAMVQTFQQPMNLIG
jgi:uroporphyrinogen decarboxylase